MPSHPEKGGQEGSLLYGGCRRGSRPYPARRVLCLDCDIGLPRDLDLALGLSDRTLMDFSDVAQNHCFLELAAGDTRDPRPFPLTAPARPHGRPVTEIQM